MKLRAWICNGWFMFSALMSVVIFVFLAVPFLFGFQDFVQWGAMYDDRFCNVAQYEKSPYDFPDTKFSMIIPGVDDHRVYAGPSANHQSCLALARMSCGKKAKDGWTITWVEPEMQRVRYMGKVNICSLKLSSLDYWFFDAQ